MRKLLLALLCCLSFEAQAQQVFNNPNGTQFLNQLILGAVGTASPFRLNGTTSGQITITPQAVAGTYSLLLPNTAGTSGNALATGGNGGNMSWIDTTNASSLASGTVPILTLGNNTQVRYKLLAANLNSTADQPIAITLPTGVTNYRVNAMFMSNPSISMTTAVCGLWTATAKGGVVILGTGTGGGATGVAMSGLTTNTVGTAGSLVNETLNSIVNTAMFNSATLYFVCSTAQGAPATADVVINLLLLN